MVPALQPAVAAPHGLLPGVAGGHELAVLTGVVELYAAVEALQARTLTYTRRSVPPRADALRAVVQLTSLARNADARAARSGAACAHAPHSDGFEVL